MYIILNYSSQYFTLVKKRKQRKTSNHKTNDSTSPNDDSISTKLKSTNELNFIFPFIDDNDLSLYSNDLIDYN